METQAAPHPKPVSKAPTGNFLFAQGGLHEKTGEYRCHLSFSSEDGNINLSINMDNANKMAKNLVSVLESYCDHLKLPTCDGK